MIKLHRQNQFLKFSVKANNEAKRSTFANKKRRNSIANSIGNSMGNSMPSMRGGCDEREQLILSGK
jgi:hypothetical protein